jgi:hypothetical protein
LGQGVLFETTIDPKADRAEQKIGHSHHEIDALIVTACFAEWIAVILRTGGGDGFLSGRASVHRARQRQRYDDEEQTEQPHGRTHIVIHSPISGAMIPFG